MSKGKEYESTRVQHPTQLQHPVIGFSISRSLSSFQVSLATETGKKCIRKEWLSRKQSPDYIIGWQEVAFRHERASTKGIQHQQQKLKCFAFIIRSHTTINPYRRILQPFGSLWVTRARSGCWNQNNFFSKLSLSIVCRLVMLMTFSCQQHSWVLEKQKSESNVYTSNKAMRRRLITAFYSKECLCFCLVSSSSFAYLLSAEREKETRRKWVILTTWWLLCLGCTRSTHCRAWDHLRLPYSWRRKTFPLESFDLLQQEEFPVSAHLTLYFDVLCSLLS